MGVEMGDRKPKKNCKETLITFRWRKVRKNQKKKLLHSPTKIPRSRSPIKKIVKKRYQRFVREE